MPTLTAIQSYLGWHISLMGLVWCVFVIRFDRVAKGFFKLRDEACWKAQVLRWGFIIALNLVIPAVLAMPAFYYTGFVRPIGWMIRTSEWIGLWELCTILVLMAMLRFGSGRRCCCDPHHGHRRSNPNRRRHPKAKNEVPHEAV